MDSMWKTLQQWHNNFWIDIIWYIRLLKGLLDKQSSDFKVRQTTDLDIIDAY